MFGWKVGFDTAANEVYKVGCAASYQLYLYLLSGTQVARERAVDFRPLREHAVRVLDANHAVRDLHDLLLVVAAEREVHPARANGTRISRRADLGVD